MESTFSNSGDRPIIRGNVSWGNRQCGIHMNGDVSQGGDGIISGALVENNVIFGNGRGGGSGINCDGVQDSKIPNNLLYDNHASGISLYRIDGAAGSNGNSVINNTIVQAANARWAVNIKNRSTSNVVCEQHSFPTMAREAASTSPRIRCRDFGATLTLSWIASHPTTATSFMRLSAWRSATGLDRHSQVSKPQDVFVNPASSDYHLRDGSPAIDAADPAMAPSSDIDGRNRPIGVRPDIGAYEANDSEASSKH